MANARKQDIDLGITRLEYGEASRERRAVLQIETSKYYNGGLISDADVYWVGASSRQRMVSLGDDSGDYGKRLFVSAKDVRATQGAIDRQHAEVFTADVIARLTQAAKDHYAAIVRVGIDAYKNVYPRPAVAGDMFSEVSR